MFCSNCGEALPQESMFCPKCGSKQNVNTTDNKVERNHIVTVDTLNQAGILESDFKDRIDSVDDRQTNDLLFTVYNKLIEPVRIIENIKDRLEINDEKLEEARKKQKSKLLYYVFPFKILFSLLAVLMFILFLGKAISPIVCSDYEELNAKYQTSEQLQSEYPDINDYWEECGFWYRFLYGRLNEAERKVMNTITFVFATIFSVVWHKHDFDKFKRKTSEIVKELEDNEAKMKKDMQQIIDAIEPLICYCPPKYRSSDALRYFVDSYSNTRVNNLKEAVLEYDTLERHREIVNKLEEIRMAILGGDNQGTVMEALGVLAGVMAVGSFLMYGD